MQPSHQLVEQRIRNRLVEWLEAAACAGETEDIGELVNQWSDWTNDEPVAERFGSAAFTPPELQALARVQADLEQFCRVTPRLLRLDDGADWSNVKASAVAALGVFSARGFLPEDQLLP